MLVMESCYIYIIKHFLWCLFCGSGLNTARTASSKTWKIKTIVKIYSQFRQIRVTIVCQQHINNLCTIVNNLVLEDSITVDISNPRISGLSTDDLGIPGQSQDRINNRKESGSKKTVKHIKTKFFIQLNLQKIKLNYTFFDKINNNLCTELPSYLSYNTHETINLLRLVQIYYKKTYFIIF